jgi:hypothetical protein
MVIYQVVMCVFHEMPFPKKTIARVRCSSNSEH